MSLVGDVVASWMVALRPRPRFMPSCQAFYRLQRDANRQGCRNKRDLVQMPLRLAASRIADWLAADQLPRIC